MAVKTFTTGEVLTAADTNTYLNNGGLVYIKSQTIGTAVSSVTVSNAFSSTYDNYRVTVSGVTTSVADTVMQGQIGAATSGYNSAMRLYKLGSGDVTLAQSSAANFYCAVHDSNNTVTVFDVFSPNLARYTVWSGGAFGYLSQFTFGGELQNTTQYTDITFTAFSGTYTGGTITVYGYRKA